MTLITAELLHEAADKLATMEQYPEGAEIERFMAESTFENYEVDEASVAYGIAIGILVMLIEVPDNTTNTTTQE